jgi:hypothetical protein
MTDPLLEERRKAIIDDAKANPHLTTRELAERNGATLVFVSETAYRAGIKLPRARPKIDPRKETLIEILTTDPNSSLQTVARRLHLSLVTARKWWVASGRTRPVGFAGRDSEDIDIPPPTAMVRANIDYMHAPFRDVLKAHCAANGLTYETLGDRLGCSKKAVRQWTAPEGSTSHRKCPLEWTVRFALTQGI